MNGTGTNYANAFFDINYVKVFSLDDVAFEPSIAPGGSTTLIAATGVPTSGGGNANTNGSGSGSGSGSGGGNGAVSAKIVGATVVSASFVAAFAWALM